MPETTHSVKASRRAEGRAEIWSTPDETSSQSQTTSWVAQTEGATLQVSAVALGHTRRSPQTEPTKPSVRTQPLTWTMSHSSGIHAYSTLIVEATFPSTQSLGAIEVRR